MDILIIIIAIVLLLMSLLLLLASPIAGIIGIAIGAYCLYYGLKLRKAKRSAPAQPQAAMVITPQQAPTQVRYNCAVVGLGYRKEAVKSLLAENEEYKHPKKRRSRIYKYEYFEGPAILAPEPTNKYDPNAIKVMVNGVHIGYIPADECQQVRMVCAQNFSSIINIYGGPYKWYDHESEKWYSDTKDFSAKLRIY